MRKTAWVIIASTIILVINGSANATTTAISGLVYYIYAEGSETADAVPGADVTLYKGDGAGGWEEFDTTTTDGDGYYIFDDIDAGDLWEDTDYFKISITCDEQPSWPEYCALTLVRYANKGAMVHPAGYRVDTIYAPDCDGWATPPEGEPTGLFAVGGRFIMDDNGTPRAASLNPKPGESRATCPDGQNEIDIWG